MKTTIILAQLGTPKSPDPRDIRDFLAKFLGSKKVVDFPRILWWPILHLFILPNRPKKISSKYQWLFDKFGFNPLLHFTDRLAKLLTNTLTDIRVEPLYVLDESSLNRLQMICRESAKVIVIPQYPQYSEATTGLIKEKLSPLDTKFDVVESFHRDDFYIDATVRQIKEHIGESTHLLLSFHSYPKKRIEKGDPYFDQCVETFTLLRDRIDFIDRDKIQISFQSKFGKGEWLGPTTVDLSKKHRDENNNFAVHCPSFLVDSLETTFEIGHELPHELNLESSKFNFIPSLNDKALWVEKFAGYLNQLRAS